MGNSLAFSLPISLCTPTSRRAARCMKMYKDDWGRVRLKWSARLFQTRERKFTCITHDRLKQVFKLHNVVVYSCNKQEDWYLPGLSAGNEQCCSSQASTVLQKSSTLAVDTMLLYSSNN